MHKRPFRPTCLRPVCKWVAVRTAPISQRRKWFTKSSPGRNSRGRGSAISKASSRTSRPHIIRNGPRAARFNARRGSTRSNVGFSSYDQLIQAITASGQSDHYDFFKAGTAPTATAVWHTCWADPGAPAAGATPATTPGTSYSTTAGGIGFPNVSTKTRHMLTFGASAVQNCALMVYDRLVAVSGIGTTTTGSKDRKS